MGRIDAILPALAALALASAAAGAEERAAHRFDSWVDLSAGVRLDSEGNDVRRTRERNACALIQGALNPYLDARRREEGRHYRVRISGSATVTRDDLRRVQYLGPGGEVRGDGPYEYCFGLIPTGGGVCRGTHRPGRPCRANSQCRGGDVCERGPGVRDGYPVSDGSTLTETDARLTLYWDDARVAYDPDAFDDGKSDQERPVVIYQRGDEYVSGHGAGTIRGGLVERGHREIDIVDDGNSRPPWPAGAVVPLDRETLMESPSTTIAEFTFGVYKPVVSGLSIVYDGDNADTDDIGLLTIDGWAHRRTGGSHILRFAAGAQFYGNSATTLTNCYFPFQPNGANLVLGDGVNAGRPLFWNRCVAGGRACEGRVATSVSALNVSDCTIEGARFGNLVMFSGGSRLSFNRDHFEHVVKHGHNILIGAGRCDGKSGQGEVAPNGRTCGSDRECASGGGGRCVTPRETSGARVGFGCVEFLGSTFSRESGKQPSALYDVIYLGKGAVDDDALLLFSGGVGSSRDATGKQHTYFGADPAATVRISFDGTRRRQPRVVYPDYDHVVSNAVISVGNWYVDDASYRPPDCVRPFARRGPDALESDEPTCASPANQVMLPAGRWWLKRLSLYPTVRTADVQCTVSVQTARPGRAPETVASIQFPTDRADWPGQVAQLPINSTIESATGAEAVMLHIADKGGRDRCEAGSGRCRCHRAHFQAVIEAIRYPGGEL